MAKESPAELPIKRFKDQNALAVWLEKNHAGSKGVWLRFAKASSGAASVSYREAVEVALCYGWIDGQAKALDETAWLQRFTPRGVRSVWSKINRAKAEGFIADGRMRPAGLAAVEHARTHGRWEAAYDSPSNAIVPDDLQAALNKNAKARTFFAKISKLNRYAILHRIQTAKKAETRERRIKKFVDMLAKHETVHP